jgi:hypothetical protein
VDFGAQEEEEDGDGLFDWRASLFSAFFLKKK